MTKANTHCLMHFCKPCQESLPRQLSQTRTNMPASFPKCTHQKKESYSVTLVTLEPGKDLIIVLLYSSGCAAEFFCTNTSLLQHSAVASTNRPKMRPAHATQTPGTTPATPRQGPRLPRHTTVDVAKRHGCHIKCRGAPHDQGAPNDSNRPNPLQQVPRLQYATLPFNKTRTNPRTTFVKTQN